ncbi:SCO7460 family lipoprotein [Streptomyces sp. NPDC057249]|uniref:SCO7460 family lipoprotein n=1 Tax=Streptomyces sp. NPDC057249 TaxID=3346067 RepID=UPI003627156A
MKEQVRPSGGPEHEWGRAEMGGSPRWRTTAAGMAGALVCALAAALTGCGLVTTTKEDRAYAEKLAERYHPGVLRVIEAHTLVPHSGGSEVVFAMTDDSDAVVRMRVDAEAGTCNTHDCRDVMDEAVERGRREAAALRVLLGAFRRCGHEVIAVDPRTGAPWIAAAPTNATVSGLLKDIGACARRWKEGAEVKGASVNLVSPAVAEKRPTGEKSQPTAMRLSATPLLAALGSHAYYSAGYAAKDGRVDPASGSARIVRPFAERQKFATAVHSAVADRLRAAHPRVQVSDYEWIWRLEPGTVDRLTGYVLYCEEPDGDLECLGDRAVLATTDLDGGLLGELREIGKVREGRGPLRLPPM